MSSDVRKRISHCLNTMLPDDMQGRGICRVFKHSEGFPTKVEIFLPHGEQDEALHAVSRALQSAAGLTITAAASGPVEQRIMDAIDAVRKTHWADRDGPFNDGVEAARKAVRAALAPASEEGA